MFCLRAILLGILAGLIAATTFAQSSIPSGTPVMHIEVIVNADGSVSKLPAGTGTTAFAPCPPVPIYDQTVPSQYYFPTQGQAWDSYPLGGPALISSLTFYTFQPGGPGAVLSWAVFDYPTMPTDIYEIPCQPVGAQLCAGSVTIPSGLVITTVSFAAAPCATRCSDISICTQLSPLPGGPLAGMLIAEGSAQGLVVGHPISLLRNLYPADANGLTRGYQSSPGDSANGFFMSTTCLWFGGRPIANFCVGIRGWFSFIGHLTGDYGGPGPLLEFPDNYIKLQITDANLSFFSEEIVRVTTRDDPAGPGWFTIPFDCATAGIYDIYLYGFKGYTGQCVKNIRPIPFSMMCWDFSLISGDVTGDDMVSIDDLNAVFINFALVGCTPPPHGPKKPIIPKALQALVRCVP